MGGSSFGSGNHLRTRTGAARLPDRPWGRFCHYSNASISSRAISSIHGLVELPTSAYQAIQVCKKSVIGYLPGGQLELRAWTGSSKHLSERAWCGLLPA